MINNNNLYDFKVNAIVVSLAQTVYFFDETRKAVKQ